MPFGDTAKKVKKLSQTAEKLYARMNDLVEQIKDLRERVENTGDRLEAMERELAEQRAIVTALAEQEGIDVEEVIADVELPSERHGEGDGASEDGASSDGTGGGDSTSDSSSADAGTN